MGTGQDVFLSVKANVRRPLHSMLNISDKAPGQLVSENVRRVGAFILVLEPSYFDIYGEVSILQK